MIKPKPFKLICPKCGFSKKVSPHSDAIGIEAIQTCPKCDIPMEQKELQKSSFFSKLLGN